MPHYIWNCLACGHANPADAAACAVCACPARATLGRIDQCRARALRAGAPVLPGAALTPARLDPVAWQMLLWVLLLPWSLLAGWWPPALTADHE